MMERELLHQRELRFRGYKRSDGLYEIEGRVLDTKPLDFSIPNGGRLIEAYRPIHDLSVCIVFKKNMEIVAVNSNPQSYPYHDCQFGGRQLENLIGARIGPGWQRTIRERIPKKDVCTHLRELLIPLASAAIQSMHLEREIEAYKVDENGQPIRLNSCLAYNESGALVREYWPEFYKDN
jgi:hypothetical protein